MQFASTITINSIATGKRQTIRVGNEYFIDTTTGVVFGTVTVAYNTGTFFVRDDNGTTTRIDKADVLNVAKV